MFCPYAVNRKTVTSVQNVYDENGCCTDTVQVEENKATLLECQTENCGAWHDGECGYYRDRGR